MSERRFLPALRIRRGPATSEKGATQEALPSRTEIVVFGSRLSRGRWLAGALEEYIRQNQPDSEGQVTVSYCRDAGVINLAFFGRDPQDPATLLGKPGALDPANTKPLAVISTPQMRQYSSDGMTGMTIETPVDYIQDLCDRHGVPYWPITYEDSAQDSMPTGFLGHLAIAAGKSAQIELPPA